MRGLGESPAVRAGLIGLAVSALLLLLVLPLAVVLAGAGAEGAGAAWAAIVEPDALASIRLTLLVAAIAVPACTVFGIAAAWCIARFDFPGRRVLRAMIAVPLSVSPVVAGLSYMMVYGAQGWLGPSLSQAGLKVVFALPGIVLCTIFVTLPYVAGQLLPAMEAGGSDEEEAALTLGAGLWQTLAWVTLPRLRWGLLLGVLLCNARAMGEFGAVAVVSGRIRGATNTMPLQIEVLYNQYDLVAAFALSAVLAALALVTVAARAALEWRRRAALRGGEGAVLVR